MRSPEKNKQFQRMSRAKFYDWLKSIKSVPCTDCHLTFDPVCMDFDHVRGKKKYHIAQGHNRADILDEIAKCDIVCSNCHRLRTKRRRQLRESARMG